MVDVDLVGFVRRFSIEVFCFVLSTKGITKNGLNFFGIENEKNVDFVFTGIDPCDVSRRCLYIVFAPRGK